MKQSKTNKTAISVNKMWITMGSIPRDLDALKYKLQKGNVELFEKLFQIGGGIIEYKTRGINKGKPKYIIPSDFEYNRDIVCKHLFGITYDQLSTMKTILDIGNRLDEMDLDEDALLYKHNTEIVKLLIEERKLCRWYHASTPLLAKKSELKIFAKQPLWQSELDAVVKKCNEYIKSNKITKLIDCDTYDDMWCELHDKIDTLKDAEFNLIVLNN